MPQENLLGLFYVSMDVQNYRTAFFVDPQNTRLAFMLSQEW